MARVGAGCGQGHGATGLRAPHGAAHSAVLECKFARQTRRSSKNTGTVVLVFLEKDISFLRKKYLASIKKNNKKTPKPLIKTLSLSQGILIKILTFCEVALGQIVIAESSETRTPRKPPPRMPEHLGRTFVLLQSGVWVIL